MGKSLSCFSLYWRWGARVGQKWEHSPPTNVAWVQIRVSTPYVGWFCCGFYPLLWEVFLHVLWLYPLVKKQKFQIPIWPGIRYTKNYQEEVLPLTLYFFVYLWFYRTFQTVSSTYRHQLPPYGHFIIAHTKKIVIAAKSQAKVIFYRHFSSAISCVTNSLSLGYPQ